MLASKTLPDGLKCAFDVVVKIVNYIKNSPLNTRLFLKLGEDLNLDDKCLLYKVQWLLRSNLLAIVFKLRDEIFLETPKPELAVHFENVKFFSHLAYMVNIFEALNQLNFKMQGIGKDIKFADFINAFVEKLGNWKRTMKKTNFDIFHRLTCLSKLNDLVKDEVANHISTLQTVFNGVSVFEEYDLKRHYKTKYA